MKAPQTNNTPKNKMLSFTKHMFRREKAFSAQYMEIERACRTLAGYPSMEIGQELH